MIKWLASIQSLEEAQTLAGNLPDILDLKNPAAGALGALSLDSVREVVDWVDHRCLTSATVGDLPMQADIIGPALQAMSLSRVDYLKIGIFADDDCLQCLQQLEPYLAELELPVIAVLFADQQQDLNLLDLVKRVGFAGVMVDTAAKDGRSLLQHWNRAQLKAFVNRAKSLELLCGLAGALRIEDIDALKVLSPDYLGFRSALCPKQQRNDSLQPELARLVQHQLQAPLEMTA